jgi:hypothetical protein
MCDIGFFYLLSWWIIAILGLFYWIAYIKAQGNSIDEEGED